MDSAARPHKKLATENMTEGSLPDIEAPASAFRRLLEGMEPEMSELCTACYAMGLDVEIPYHTLHGPDGEILIGVCPKCDGVFESIHLTPEQRRVLFMRHGDKLRRVLPDDGVEP